MVSLVLKCRQYLTQSESGIFFYIMEKYDTSRVYLGDDFFCEKMRIFRFPVICIDTPCDGTRAIYIAYPRIDTSIGKSEIVWPDPSSSKYFYICKYYLSDDSSSLYLSKIRMRVAMISYSISF